VNNPAISPLVKSVVVGVELRVWFFIRERMEDDILVESKREKDAYEMESTKGEENIK
jgi:hypothetical protein